MIPICASLFITMLATQPIRPPMISVTIKSISILLWAPRGRARHPARKQG